MSPTSLATKTRRTISPNGKLNSISLTESILDTTEKRSQGRTGPTATNHRLACRSIDGSQVLVRKAVRFGNDVLRLPLLLGVSGQYIYVVDIADCRAVVQCILDDVRPALGLLLIQVSLRIRIRLQLIQRGEELIHARREIRRQIESVAKIFKDRVVRIDISDEALRNGLGFIQVKESNLI
jgi:hypothetical protein